MQLAPSPRWSCVLNPIHRRKMGTSRFSSPLTAEEVVRGYDGLLKRVAVYARRFPQVEGIDRLSKAVTREREIALHLQLSSDPAPSVGNLQGAENNLRGLSLELDCAEWAPGVTAVRKRFATRPPSLGAKFGGDDVVEVDVVAEDGLLWIECKAEKGEVSPNVVMQALALQKKARAPCNGRRWGQVPEAAVYLTGKLGAVEAELLRAAGIRVLRARDGTTAGSQGLAAPAPPVIANLDITALFALVSEVSNGGASDPDIAPAVREWAARVPQHAMCLAAELENPLNLAGKLRGYERLIVHPSVMERFLKVLNTVGGPRECRRWQDVWRAQIHVMAPEPQDLKDLEGTMMKTTTTTMTKSRGGSGGGSSSRSGPRENEREVQRRRVRGLTRISAPQLDAFELGEVAMAKTFTGNSRAVNLAKEQGVYLEVFVFRAIWLVGV